jgi:signal transduction histidine kinase
MAKTSAERKSGPLGLTRCAALALGPTLISSVPANAQSFAPPPGLDAMLGNVIWWAVTGGTAVAAFVAFGLLFRARGDQRLTIAQREIVTLRAARDRAEALLGADDQRTIVWDTAVGEPQIFGALPEAVGAPSNEAAFLIFSKWLDAGSAASIEAAVDKLRREGEPFQLAARAANGAVLEVSGRTSGRRSLVRFRELTGERRSFAELKEQAVYVINEMSALRALADMLPIPLWRRNRTGRLTWVNVAYTRAVEAESQEAVLSSGIELLPLRTREAIREAARAGQAFEGDASAVMAGNRRQLRIFEKPIADGSVGGGLDVSEVDTVRQKLAQVADSNAKTLDRLTAGVAVFGRDGRLLFHNVAFRSIWGLAADWLTSAPQESEVLDRLRTERKLPEQSNYRDWRTKHLAAYLSAQPHEDVWHLPDGRTLRVVAVPNSDGGMSYIYENVTEQISLESRVAALSTLQGETLDHLFEAVAVFGTDGRLRLFNPAFANMWRLSPTTLRAEPHIGDIIATCQAIYSDKPTWDQIRAAVTDLDHEGQAFGRMARPDGSVIDFATVALPEGMTMLTFVDVTDSAAIERVLKERNEALEAADRLKSDFIQHVSYELRTPLTNIIGQAEILANETFGKLNPKQRDYMGDILNSSEALRALINDILDLATVDAGIMSLDIQETDIIAAVASSIEGLRDRLSEQKIALDFDVPEDIGTFHVDPQRIRQILFNLLSNAIRFSNAGGHIHVKAEKSGNLVTFTVIDDGVGIPKDLLPTVFQPFETHGSQGRRGGAGLGLSIVKSLVELHGGDVEIRSEEGEGTTAIVRLPVMPAAMSVAAE